MHVAGLVAERGGLPPGVPLLKHVGAVAGNDVCMNTVLRVHGEFIGPLLPEDAAGPLYWPDVRTGSRTVREPS